MDFLTQTIYCCGEDAQGEKSDRLFACRYRISALIDRGRFFLPNIRPEEHGSDKPAAYRGYRHSALDPLVAAERVLATGRTGSFTDRHLALLAMKREFVSALQQILDPQHHNLEIARIIADGHEAQREDPTLGGLLPDNRNIPLGADALLANPRSRHLDARQSDSQ